MEKLELELFADYYQFYLQDDEQGKGDLDDAWSQEAVDRLLATTDYAIGIGTVRDMDVPVTVEMNNAKPSINPDEWEHIVLTSIKCETGRLVIAGCTDYFPDAIRIELKPGDYHVLVCYKGLDTLSDDGLDGDDMYHLFIYPGSPTDVNVIKSRKLG